MHILVNNVNEALYRGVSLLHDRHDDHRYGKLVKQVAPRGMLTREWHMPVVTTYYHPQERVLFSPERDANPFFHLMEALWMLAGRNDVEFLDWFNSRMKTYSDDGTSFHGAYGYRWRKAFGVDQILRVVDRIRNDKETRQAVISMYSPLMDGYHVYRGKDVPCNTIIFFNLRDNRLNMTVSCRSNDMLWGAYGANAVHFSVLQEYVAMLLGVEIGHYTQLSNSFHVYTEGEAGDLWNRVKDAPLLHYDYYETQKAHATPLNLAGASAESFQHDLELFFHCMDTNKRQIPGRDPFKTAFFGAIVLPMLYAFVHRVTAVLDCHWDWHLAAAEWIQRREERKAAGVAA